MGTADDTWSAHVAHRQAPARLAGGRPCPLAFPSARSRVSVVTGGGKTLLALACMAEVRAALPDCRYLIVVPTVALLDQWVSELENGLGVGRDDIAMHGGGFSGPADRRVHVAVINTASIPSAETPCRRRLVLHRRRMPQVRRTLQSRCPARPHGGHTRPVGNADP